jgi:hypothetical protein
MDYVIFFTLFRFLEQSSDLKKKCIFMNAQHTNRKGQRKIKNYTISIFRNKS